MNSKLVTILIGMLAIASVSCEKPESSAPSLEVGYSVGAVNLSGSAKGWKTIDSVVTGYKGDFIMFENGEVIRASKIVRITGYKLKAEPKAEAKTKLKAEPTRLYKKESYYDELYGKRYEMTDVPTALESFYDNIVKYKKDDREILVFFKEGVASQMLYKDLSRDEMFAILMGFHTDWEEVGGRDSENIRLKTSLMYACCYDNGKLRISSLRDNDQFAQALRLYKIVTKKDASLEQKDHDKVTE